MTPLADAGKAVTQVVVPFAGAPDLWETSWFGAPVVRGDAFAVRLDTGETLHP